MDNEEFLGMKQDKGDFMVIDIYKSIIENEHIDSLEVRQGLSALRKEMKAEEVREELIEYLEDDITIVKFLKSTDGKIRKNTALFLGDLAIPETLDDLFQAYQKESTMFVRSAYLTALAEFDYRKYLPELKSRLEELEQIQLTPENRKHITEEMHHITELIMMLEGAKHHEFRGNRLMSDLMVLGNREQMAVLKNQIIEEDIASEKDIFFMRAGLRFQTDQVGELRKVRTYQEILFLVKGMLSCEMNPKDGAETIISSDLLEFMKQRHKGKVPFYFRIEIKSKRDLKWKSNFTKKLAAGIEEGTNRQLINSTSHYEFEIRLIENAKGRMNMMVKLYTMHDHRFEYRKGAVATSMKPVNAALLVELAKPYMIEDAQVLDPFCGVGTLLLERQKIIKGNTSYGIDEMAEAIEKAKLNTEEAGQIIHYINKDFFEFTHEYLFDEVFTDMPFAMGNTTQEDIRVIYEKFFKRIRHYIKEDATLILYVRNPELLERLAKKYQFEIKEEFLVDEKNQGKLYILK